MNALELDKKQRRRVDGLWKDWKENRPLRVDDIFISSQALELIDDDKILFGSLQMDRLLAALPFTKSAFVRICPLCVRSENVGMFMGLVQAGMVVPILGAPYKAFPTELVDLIKSKDHISLYEYMLFRTAQIGSDAEFALCGHCVKKRGDEIAEIIKGRKGAPGFREHLEVISRNLHPFVFPDYELLDCVETAFRDSNKELSRQLVDMSFLINSVRDSQAFQAPLSIPAGNFEHLDQYGIGELAELQRVASELRELVAEGLALRIPIDLTPNRYIGLVREVRPSLLQITGSLVGQRSGDADNEVSIREVFNAVQDVNREIERIEATTRYAFINAVTSTVTENKELLGGALLAGALGLAGSMTACATTAAGGAGLQALRKKGKIKGSVAVKQLGRAIHRDLEPLLNKLMASYVDSSELPIQVMAARRKIGRATEG